MDAKALDAWNKSTRDKEKLFKTKGKRRSKPISATVPAAPNALFTETF